MKNIQFNFLKAVVVFSIANLLVSCERDLSDEATQATYPKTAEVFTDAFGGGIRDWEPYGDSKFTVFSVDTDVAYKGTSSIRIDVPNTGDIDGGYAGGIFRDKGGRNLTGYDALTFWAKATKAGTLNEVGFGEDFYPNKYIASIANVNLTTNWVKYTIPIPDASVLVMEKGMFRFAEAPENGEGYTIWFDEIKFEKLGTIAHQQPKILNGQNQTQQSFNGVNITIGGLTSTFNLENGVNQVVNAAYGYFNFSSSNTNVATVNEFGVVSIIGTGTAVITATSGGQNASGSLTITSLGNFVHAPTPTRPSANVTSVFSNAYSNIPVDFYNGFWAPYQTTTGGNNLIINNDNIIQYSSLNFVGIQFATPTVNATSRTHMHIDIFVDEAITSGDNIKIEVNDFGADGVFGGGNDTTKTFTITATGLQTGVWKSFDIPFTSFIGSTNRANLAQIVLNSNATISKIMVDNIYFYNN